MQKHGELSHYGHNRRFFAFFPPRSASFNPYRRRSQSFPNGPRM
jgi:hypothetical protein